LATSSNHAAKKAKDYTITVGGVVYNDWFLPSYNELLRLNTYKSLVGGIDSTSFATYGDSRYQSSTLFLNLHNTNDPAPYNNLGDWINTYSTQGFFGAVVYTDTTENKSVDVAYSRPPTANLVLAAKYSPSDNAALNNRVRPVRSFSAAPTSSNTITHNFNSDEIAVVIRSEISPYDILNNAWHVINANSIELDYGYDDGTLKTVAVFNRLGDSPGVKNIDDFSVDAPTYADDAGNVGEVSWDEDYLYICVAKDTWKRLSLSSWD